MAADVAAAREPAIRRAVEAELVAGLENHAGARLPALVVPEMRYRCRAMA